MRAAEGGAPPGTVTASGPSGSSAVAAGSTAAVDAAVAVLRRGGNAVDAALAAGFAAAMSEPALTSLGGGGFLLHAEPGRDPQVLDFFCDVPGRGGGSVRPHVDTIVVDFAKAGPAASASEQVFHGGWGTVAVPGCLTGYLDAHRRWGRIDLADVVSPAVRLAREGVVLESMQMRFLHLVADLLAITPESRSAFAAVQANGRYANAAYGDLLDALGRGEITGVHDAPFAVPLLVGSRDGGGALTQRDLSMYAAVVRDPLAVTHAGARVWTNPLPSFGGSIVADSLLELSAGGVGAHDWARLVSALADATQRRRGPFHVSTGTTHVSVVDADGAVAAMTTSNGSGSGTLVPGWGVPLNNMMGEEDLLPVDGSRTEPGMRMSSMMSPTIVDLADGSRVALGTGGSERIRSALLCVLVRLADHRTDLADAIAGARVHVSPPGPIHIEPGLADAEVRDLADLAVRRGWPDPEAWPSPSLYFGGVHAVTRRMDGSVEAVGDQRRSGAAAVVLPGGDVRSGVPA